MTLDTGYTPKSSKVSFMRFCTALQKTASATQVYSCVASTQQTSRPALLNKSGFGATFWAGLELLQNLVATPEEFQNKLAENPALETAFQALTPGR
jgi:hypothetical protein